MFRFLVVALLAASASSADLYLPRLPLNVLLRGDVQLIPKIVGGTQAAEGEFPWQVSLQYQGLFGWSHFCGGSVGSADAIITASHCLDGFTAREVRVVAGEHNRNTDSGNEQMVDASRLTMHENYNANTIYNDVGVITLASSLSLNTYVQAVKLPTAGQDTPAGTTLTVTGWGTTSESGSLATVLMKVDVPAVSDAECRSAYGQTDVADSMICAGFPEGGSDSCQGDSGGPLVDASGTLIGIVSWGYGCARPGYPGVYTEVSYFVDWINSHM